MMFLNNIDEDAHSAIADKFFKVKEVVKRLALADHDILENYKVHD